MFSFKVGDVVENWIGIPIPIVEITPDYYISTFGKWVERQDKTGKIILHPFDERAPKVINSAAHSTNGSGPTNGQLPPSSLPRPMSDLLAHQFKPQEYLVDGLIAKGHLGILGGRPKSGKSWLGLQLAMCIDTGDRKSVV